MLSLIVLASIFCCLIFWQVLKLYVEVSRFKRLGLKCLSVNGYLSSLMKMFLKVHSFHEHFNNCTHPFPDQMFVGSFEGTTPIIMARSPEGIKKICVENSRKFVNHKLLVHGGSDTIFDKQIFFMKDDKWQKMRSAIRPAFTSAKVKKSFDSLMEYVEVTMEKYKEMCTIGKSETGSIEVDAMKLMMHHTCGYFAKIIFNEDSKETIDTVFDVCKKANPLTSWGLLKLAILRCVPKFLRGESIQILSKDLLEYFREATKKVIEWRCNNSIYIPDMVQMLIDARKDFQIDDLAGQVLQLSSTYSTSMPNQLANTLHELARNSAIMERLQAEIDEVNKRTKGKISVEEINKMEYIDMFISESFRKWPAASLTDRVCTEDCDLGIIDDKCKKPLTIKKNDMVVISIYSIHNDPMYWENPEKFDPERFSPENKTKIIPYTYIPFGVGSRHCIAMPHALLHMKLVIYYFLLNFNIKRGSKMKNDNMIRRHTLVTCFEGGSWVEIEPRFP